MNSHPERSRGPRKARGWLCGVGSEGSLFPYLLSWSTIGRTRGTKAFSFLLALLLFAWAAAIHAQSAPQPPSDAFTDRAASTLLRQLSASLQGHSEKQFLALFDLTKMKSGPLFKQQIDSFFLQTESISVHMNLMETSTEVGGEAMAVEAEMEVQPSNGGAVWRRNERLVLTAVRSGKNWKLNDVRPRSFFYLP